MKSRKLTLATLRAMGACVAQQDEFESRYGESVDVTEELCAGVAGVFDFSWAAQLLGPRAQDEYKCIHAPAWDDYVRAVKSGRAELTRIIAPALAEYARIIKAAGVEYARIVAPARAEYDHTIIAAAGAEYDRIRDAALAEYERARNAAKADYERTIAPAVADYQRTIASAWARAYIDDKGE